MNEPVTNLGQLLRDKLKVPDTRTMQGIKMEIMDVNRDINELETKKRALEVELNELAIRSLKGMGLYMHFIKTGQKMACIKTVREDTGLGLEEAKDFVEDTWDTVLHYSTKV